MRRDLLLESSDTFRIFGFVVLKRCFDPGPLAAEVDCVLGHGVERTCADNGARFRYVPMMTRATPASLSLLDSVETMAEAILGGPVLPTRAKATRYVGNTNWHVDSAAPVTSIGVLAYLDPLRSRTGTLRILPGSHHAVFAEAIHARRSADWDDHGWPGYVVATEPGDLIVLDEHVWHASAGGGIRRQWRVDFLRVPHTAEMTMQTKAYFADLYAPTDDIGYDATRYPSYGRDWRESGRPAVERLRALGVYELASAHEGVVHGCDYFAPVPANQVGEGASSLADNEAQEGERE